MNPQLLKDAYLAALLRARARQPRIAIKIFLLRSGKKQKEIAQALGLDKSTVSLMLSGKLRLEKRLDEIAGYLGINRKKLDRLILANGNNSKRRAA